jgi:hypothetical protein
VQVSAAAALARGGTVARVTDEQFIRVVFVDAASGVEFGRADLPAEQLPDSFETGTALTLADTEWSVERAEPPTSAEFRAAGALALTLRRVDLIDPREVLFSLPTICDAVPPAEQLRWSELTEDDWRQIEFVAAGLTDVVETQFQAIREIYENHAEFGDDDSLVGFRRLHVREHPAAPLPGLVSKQRLLGLLPDDPDHEPDPDADSLFARTIGPTIVYGLSDGDAVTVLGVQFEEAPEPALAGPLREVMTTFHLVLVDWCRCALIGPADLDTYLAEESGV